MAHTHPTRNIHTHNRVTASGKKIVVKGHRRSRQTVTKEAASAPKTNP